MQVLVLLFQVCNTASMRNGKCKLCLHEKPLCKSHLIPRAVYLLCRAQKATNPNPMMVTHKLAMQTSRQFQDYLLCFECEQLLRARGEDWVIPQLAKSADIFPLGQALRASPHLFDEPDVTAYALAGHPTIRPADLVHFAMGIFWKAAVHAWLPARKKSFVSLGEYEDKVREFLLGKAGFPANMALSLAVLPMPVVLIAFQFPFETLARPEDRTFHLYVSGVNF